jgi:hypothetical protein
MATERRGEMIAAISAVALFIIMFFSWFGIPEANIQTPAGGVQFDISEVPGVDTTANAWQAFDFIDIVLLVTIVVAVGMFVVSATQSNVNLPVAGSAIIAGLGILSTLLVLYRIINPPGDLDRKFGVFLGLIACAGIAIGGWLAMQEEGTSFAGEADRFGGGPGEGGPPPGGPPPGGPPAGGPPPPPPATGP